MRRRIARFAVVALCLGVASVCIPVVAGAAAQPALSVRAGVLVEASSSQQLYAFRADEELPIASTTKLMTALVTLERVRDLNTVFAQNSYRSASVDSQIGLEPGERMTVSDLLTAMLVPSADDAAEDLAYNVGGRSVGRFVAMMNVRARELGLTRTHYATPIGLDTPGNYSTASDLVRIATYLLRHYPFFARVVELPRARLRTGSHPRIVVNRNDLVGQVPWITGVKTGHTLGAGYVLVGSGTRGGMTLVSAVLGTASPASRDANTMALLDYGFAHFRLANPIRADEVLARTTVNYRTGLHASLIAAHGVARVVARGTVLTVRVQAPHRLAGPLRRGAVLGTATVLANGHPIASTPLLLARALSAVSPLTIAAQFLTRGSTLVVLVVLLVAAVGLAVLRRERARGKESGRLQQA